MLRSEYLNFNPPIYLKTISTIESKYALYATTNSFRDGKKSVYGFTPPKWATDMVKRLKSNDPTVRDQLGLKSFNKNSEQYGFKILRLIVSSVPKSIW